MKVTITPPMPSQKEDRFVVVVEGRIMGLGDPRMSSTVQKWRTVRQKGLSAEVVALQLAVELHRSLDNEELERERAALSQGAMF